MRDERHPARARGAFSVIVTDVQLPGDRPAAQPARDAVGRDGAQRPDRDQPAAGVGRRACGCCRTAATPSTPRSPRPRCSAVVEPTMTGIGGDLFAIVYDADEDAARRSTRAAARRPRRRRRSSRARPRRRSRTAACSSVTVPGVVDGWAELRRGTARSRWRARSRRPSATRATASRSARSSRDQWKAASACSRATRRPRRRSCPTAARPRPGEVFRNPTLAATLELIATGGRDAFYRGPIAQGDRRRHDSARRPARPQSDLAGAPLRLGRADLDHLSRLRRARAAAQHAGHRRARDAQHPRGLRPEGARPQLAPTYLHLLVEAKRIAFADRDAYLADPGDDARRGARSACCRRTTRRSAGKEINRTSAAASYAPLALGGPAPRRPRRASARRTATPST